MEPHGEIVCSCGAWIARCRCPGPHLAVETRERGCSVCIAVAAREASEAAGDAGEAFRRGAAIAEVRVARRRRSSSSIPAVRDDDPESGSST